MAADHAGVWSSLGITCSTLSSLLPDLRGHGESAATTMEYTLRCRRDRDLGPLGWYAANIVGHSWTGKLALIWARHIRFQSLILVDPFFINQPSWMKYLSPSSTAPCHFSKPWGRLQV